MFGPELVEAFREFKSIWDPEWKMNPGKVVDPYRITENLRLGTDYRPPQVDAHFAYPDDGGSFAHATTRCVGIGKCRRLEPKDGVMCPSFMVTREEKHTTRGRARILWEMLNGEELELWRSEEVLDALDLCLSCKGCTNDCPVSVDMPTLKAEFLAHHYAGRVRPRHADAFGNHLTMPGGHVCCGRPLYDYGFLRLARRYLERTLDTLRDEIRAGVPVVGIEPSCMAVFKDELPKLLPDDEDGRRLCKQSFHFAEFLQEHAEGWEPPQLHRSAILHGHCHHRATGGVEGEQKLLERMGVQVEKLETTCCG